jgi:hypothetical protein
VVNARIRKVKLVAPESSGYRKFCAEHQLQRQSFRAKLAPTASNQLSLIFEQAVREWLGEQIPLMPERILWFEEQAGQFGYNQKYREIDAISQYRSQPDYLFEIKTSFDPKNIISKACNQLNQSLYITSHRWSNLKTCIIYINTSPQDALNLSEIKASNVEFFSTLEFLQTGVEDEKIPCLILSGIDVWQIAVQRGLSDKPSLWTEAQAETIQNIHNRKEREALIAKDIPREYWSESLRQQNRSRSTPQIAYFDELASETNLGAAFQNALQKQKLLS